MRLVFCCLALVLNGCEAPRLDLGDSCVRATDCREPFVCRDGRCRVECQTSRDCEPGAACVLDGTGLGTCLFPEESTCQIPSDCPPQLDCVMSQCRNACEDDRDCDGGTCVTDATGRRSCAASLDGGVRVDGAIECASPCTLEQRCCDGQCVSRAVPVGVVGRDDPSFLHCGACDRACDPVRADGCRRLAPGDPPFCTCGAQNACPEGQACTAGDGGPACSVP